MSASILAKSVTDALVNRLSGLDQSGGNPRVKQIVERVIADMFRTIEEFDVTPTEFWTTMSYLTEVGQRNEYGLLAAGLGIEHFLDLIMDEQERRAGLEGGTPRTIEGPLYVAGAPIGKGEVRLDDGAEEGEVLFMEGQVKDMDGRPVPGAVVDIWHANKTGGYSFFDRSQSQWNLRRRVETDGEGRYRFRTILPSGYAVPPDGPTKKLLDQLGRHGNRPAHIHFFVSAPGYRKLTTQINIAGDAFLHDDFAFGTRDDLIPAVTRNSDSLKAKAHGLNAPYAEIAFDFMLHKDERSLPDTVVTRDHAPAV